MGRHEKLLDGGRPAERGSVTVGKTTFQLDHGNVEERFKERFSNGNEMIIAAARRRSGTSKYVK